MGERRAMERKHPWPYANGEVLEELRVWSKRTWILRRCLPGAMRTHLWKGSPRSGLLWLDLAVGPP